MKQLLVIAALAIVIATVAGCHKPKEEDDFPPSSPVPEGSAFGSPSPALDGFPAYKSWNVS